jgi:hypothetical protein
MKRNLTEGPYPRVACIVNAATATLGGIGAGTP